MKRFFDLILSYSYATILPQAIVMKLISYFDFAAKDMEYGLSWPCSHTFVMFYIPTCGKKLMGKSHVYHYDTQGLLHS